LDLHYYYLFCSLFALFLLTLLLIRKKPRFYYFFLANLFIVSFTLLYSYIENDGWFLKYPHLFRIASPLQYLIAPFTFFMVSLGLNPERKFRRYDLLHFLPFAFHVAELIPFYLQTASQKLAFIESLYYGAGNPWFAKDGLFFSFRTHIIIKFSLLLMYVLYGWRVLIGYRYAVSRRFEQLNRQVYSFLVFEVANKTILGLSILTLTIFYVNRFSVIQKAPFLMLMLDILVGGSIILLFPGLLQGVRPAKTDFTKEREQARLDETEDNTLTDSDQANPDHSLPVMTNAGQEVPLSGVVTEKQARHFQLIETIMQRDQPFTDPEFSRDRLSDISSINKSAITDAIFAHTGLSFSDYINSYRINYLCDLVRSDNKWFDYTIEAIALKSGFATRATFNNSLKRIRGIRPKDLLEELRKM
jgi:AraC-like DNA-binding protein